MAPIAGLNLQVTINNIPYSVAEFSADQQSEGLDATNSEGHPGSELNPLPAAAGRNPVQPWGLFQSRVAGPIVTRVMLKNASFDPARNPFRAPLLMRAGLYYSVLVWPNTAIGNIFHGFILLVTSIKHESTVKGLQPITIEGETDGVHGLGV